MSASSTERFRSLALTFRYGLDGDDGEYAELLESVEQCIDRLDVDRALSLLSDVFDLPPMRARDYAKVTILRDPRRRYPFASTLMADLVMAIKNKGDVFVPLLAIARKRLHDWPVEDVDPLKLAVKNRTRSAVDALINDPVEIVRSYGSLNVACEELAGAGMYRAFFKVNALNYCPVRCQPYRIRNALRVYERELCGLYATLPQKQRGLIYEGCHCMATAFDTLRIVRTPENADKCQRVRALSLKKHCCGISISVVNVGNVLHVLASNYADFDFVDGRSLVLRLDALKPLLNSTFPGRSPLEIALLYGHSIMARAFLEAGARVQPCDLDLATTHCPSMAEELSAALRAQSD